MPWTNPWSRSKTCAEFQLKSYFGDATRIQLLETAGIAEARLLVVAIDDRNRAVNLVRHVKQLYPEVWVLARAFDRGHSYELREAGADDVVIETYYSALALGGDALTAMGVHPERARRMTQSFVASEKANEDQLFETWRNIEEGMYFGLGRRYGELFVKLEESLGHAMREDARRTEDEAPAWSAPTDNH